MPPVVLERPKMSRAMWDSLKSHILKERQRKKQELEADAEVERQRKERERQAKQDSMTLSETREQISSLDSRLSELKEEKHQLFLKLKKVLNEDETRRRQLMNKELAKEAAANAHNDQISYGYISQPGVQIPPQGPQLFMQPVGFQRAPLYKVGPAPSHSHNIIPPGSIKRSRSPSPPLSRKFGPYKPPPQAMHPYPAKLQPALGLQYYPPPSTQSSQNQGQPPPQQQQHSSFSGGAPSHPPPTIFTYANAPPTRSPQTSSRDEPSKQQQQQQPPAGMYMHQQIPRGFVLESHEKFYPPPPSHQIRPTHMIHPGISIQHQPGSTSGSITSGYPIRTAASFQGRPPSPHVIYSGGSPRLAYSHPQVTSYGQQQPSVRYSLPPHHGQRD